MDSAAVIQILLTALGTLVMGYVALNQKNSDKALEALKEQGTLRGQHLEDKIVDVKLYVKEVIDEVKSDFSDLKNDVSNKQLMEKAFQKELFDEVHNMNVKLRLIEKDINVVQDLYDKRIEHEGEVLDKVNGIEYEVKSVQKKIRKLENEYKDIKRVLKDNELDNEA